MTLGDISHIAVNVLFWSKRKLYGVGDDQGRICLLYTSQSPRD